VAEVVGWKNTQQKITIRAGPGAFWGFNGYIDLDLQKYGRYIEDYYGVWVSSKVSSQKNMRIERE
jgi:hypothetical protein